MSTEKTFLLFAVSVAAFLLLPGCGILDADEEKDERLKAELAEKKETWFKSSDGDKRVISDKNESEIIMAEYHKNSAEVNKINPYPVYIPSSGASWKNTKDGGPAVVLPVNPAERIKTELNFSAAPIADVVEVFAGMLKINFVLEASLSGTVTMSLNEHLTKDELWEVFSQVLAISNAYPDRGESLVRIRTLDSLKNADFTRNKAETELGVFPLENVLASDAVPMITPFLSRGVTPLDVKNGNMLLILDTKSVMERVRMVLKELDSPGGARRCRMVIPCDSISAARLADELSEILPVMGFPVELDSEKPQSNKIQINSIDRLQIVLVSAANKEALDEVSRWMEILDREDIGEQERMYMYDIVNGKADELVKALSVMFPVEGSALKASKDGSATTDESIKSITKTSASSGASSKKKSSDKGAANVFDTPVSVFADSVHNRLLIKTTPRAYAMVKALLRRLDTIPAQVLLQVLVVEVKLNDTVKFGVEFMMKGGNGDNFENVGGTDYKNLVPRSSKNEQYGGKYYIYNPKDPSEKYGYVNALAGITNVKVISSPQVLVISHNEAEISVGDKVPIVNSEITNTASTITSNNESSTNLVRNIQYQDTGIILKVTPHVTRGDRITIDMDQTVSEAISNTTSSIDSPEIQERKLKTSMSIRNGQTIICGGIIREKRTDNLDSLPVIAQIPILRRLLGNTDYSAERTEMIVLISGTIIQEETALSSLLKRYRESVDSLIEFELKNERKPEKM